MDTEIIRLHKAGKRDESLRRFAEKYQSRLYAVARRQIGNNEDALDAVQEILIHFDESLPKFKGESSLYTWTFRLAMNVCLNYKRKHSRANQYAPLDEKTINIGLLTSESPADNPDTMCRTRFRQYVVEQALLELPEAQRAVLVLCDLEEMTAPQVAQVLEINPNAVKSRLRRARLAFKRIVDKEFQALGIEADGLHAFECTHQYLSEISVG